MNARQKAIVFILLLTNILVLCCALVAALSFFNRQRNEVAAASTRAAADATDASLALTPLPNPTDTPTRPAPTATNTLVVNSRSVAPAQATLIPLVRDDGWKTYRMPTDGFSVALPPGWEPLDVDPSTYQSMLDQMREKNPQLASTLSGQMTSLIAYGTKFFAFNTQDTSAAQKFVTNVNIIRQTVPSNISLDLYVQVNLGQLTQLAGVEQSLTHQRVSLAAGGAEKLQYHLTLKSPEGVPLTASTTQYLLMRELKAYVITFSTTVEEEKGYAPTFQKMAENFNWLASP